MDLFKSTNADMVVIHDAHFALRDHSLRVRIVVTVPAQTGQSKTQYLCLKKNNSV